MVPNPSEVPTRGLYTSKTEKASLAECVISQLKAKPNSECSEMS